MHKPFLLLLLSGLILLTGCWDKVELNDIAFVMGLGIDKTADGLYSVSFQIVNPGQVSGGQTRQQGQGTAVTTYSETGETLLEATKKVSQKIPRRLSFSHTAVLIIGERMAKAGGLKKVIDFTERFHAFRSTTFVFIAKGSQAKPILSIVTTLERVPALSIKKTMKETTALWGENTKRNINDAVQALSSKSLGLSLSGIKLIGNAEKGQTTAENQQSVPGAIVQINGLALLKNGKLQGWLDNKKARGVAWAQNKINRTVVTLKCKKKDKGAIAIEVTRSYTNLKTKMNKGQLEITVSVRVEGDLEETACPMDLTKPKTIIALDHKAATEIEKEVKAAVKIAQKQKNDVFGFGEAVERANPKAWKKMKKHWGRTFSNMDVQVKAKVFIRDTGLRTNSYEFEK